MDGSMDGWMDGSMDGSMDRWMDGSMENIVYYQRVSYFTMTNSDCL